MHDVSLTMSPDDWQSIIADSRGDEERHATLTYDGVVVDDVGVHPSGESSRFAGNPKMSIRLKFNAFAGGKFGGLSELKLKGQWDDGSMMRDGVAKFVYRSVIPTPLEGYARVAVNGELRGLYAVVQVWNEESIKEHFTEPVGPLYRIRGILGTDPYEYRGADAMAYMPLPWEPHVAKPARGDDVIGAFLNVLANSPSQIDTVADVDNLLGYLAVGAIIMSADSMVGDTGSQDHYQYFDTATGKFFSLPWDPDKTFSYNGEAPTRDIYKHFSKAAPARIVGGSSDLRARYQSMIGAVMTSVPLGSLQAEADRVYGLIHDTAHEDPVKRFDNGTYDWNLGYLKDFMAQRYANVQTQIGN